MMEHSLSQRIENELSEIRGMVTELRDNVRDITTADLIRRVRLLEDADLRRSGAVGVFDFIGKYGVNIIIIAGFIIMFLLSGKIGISTK